MAVQNSPLTILSGPNANPNPSHIANPMPDPNRIPNPRFVLRFHQHATVVRSWDCLLSPFLFTVYIKCIRQYDKTAEKRNK